MVIKHFNIGNTKIEVDNIFFPKTEEENKEKYEEFNKIGWEIINSKMKGAKND